MEHRGLAFQRPRASERGLQDHDDPSKEGSSSSELPLERVHGQACSQAVREDHGPEHHPRGVQKGPGRVHQGADGQGHRALGATAFALVLRGLGGDKLIEEALLALPFEPDGIVLSILFATFLLGFFLDWIELTLIILPLVAPVVSGLGYDPIWFTVLFAVCLQTSFLTPPVGFALFFLKGVAPPEITVRTIYKGVAPFILLQLLAMTMIFFWPQIVTWLPEQAYG